MTLSPAKRADLLARMEKLKIHESDLEEKFILGSGPGGQKVNKTASCVYLKHLPSGIEIKCNRERSRELNRFLARRELCERFEKQHFGTLTSKDIKNEKIKKQKERRKRKSKQKNNENSIQ